MIVILPMAGLARRFSDAGYILPKPIIEINGNPMIWYVLSNFDKLDVKFLPIVLKKHVDDFHIDNVLKQLIPKERLFGVHIRENISSGAAETVLDAINFFGLNNSDEELCISNCDQFIKWDQDDFIIKKSTESAHWILTFRSVSPKWSYVRIKNAAVCEVAEKNPISNIATVGIYFYNKIRDFVYAANTMMENNTTVNGEFYVCPTFNELIKRGDIIRIYDVEMIGLGTPEDLENNRDKIK